jgi:uncharacterized protein YkwD
MSTLTRTMMLALILAGSSALGSTAGTPATPQDGPHRGLWKIDPGSKRAPATADPYGFAGVLNRIRASMGLPQLGYDPTLSSWAVQNNVAQSNQGLGHHVNPNCYQNCGWNYSDAESVAAGWMNSPGHRQNMLQPNVSRFGIAFGPGPYWTMNAY